MDTSKSFKYLLKGWDDNEIKPTIRWRINQTEALFYIYFFMSGLSGSSAWSNRWKQPQYLSWTDGVCFSLSLGSLLFRFQSSSRHYDSDTSAQLFIISLVEGLSTIRRTNNEHLPAAAAGERGRMRGLGCPHGHRLAKHRDTACWKDVTTRVYAVPRMVFDLESGCPGRPQDLHPGQETKCRTGATCSCWWGHEETCGVLSHINYCTTPWEFLFFPGSFVAGVRNSFKLAEVSRHLTGCGCMEIK